MKISIYFFALFFFTSPLFAQSNRWPQGRPKLVVFIVIDQFRADYLSRFQSEFQKDGFNGLIDQGAFFPFGKYDILQCMTGPGHATVLTGAYPYQMGIPGNDWYDQKTQSKMYCAADSRYELINTKTKPNDGTSPRNLIGTTVGDELKNADIKSRIFSFSLKDRSAIMMGGHRADLVFWYDADSKQWTSSTYYLKNKKLPDWLEKWNQEKTFLNCDQSKPCGVEMTKTAFEKLFTAESIGAKDSLDFIAISFSTHDFSGHKNGPNSEAIKEVTLAEDKALADIRKLIDSKVPGGLKNVLFVLTGDHGVSPAHSYLKETGIDSGFIDEKTLITEMEIEIKKICGPSKKNGWIEFVEDFNFYLDESSLLKAKCDFSKVQKKIKSVLLKNPNFAHVFTQDEYDEKKLPPGYFARKIEKTYYKGRSGHVVGIQKPFYTNATKHSANHMSGYSYDSLVPIIFSGFGIKPGLYSEKAEIVDIAPTLSFLLGVLPPALSEGKVLSSAIKNE